MKELGLASVDVLDRHAWKRKILGDTCWPRSLHRKPPQIVSVSWTFIIIIVDLEAC